LVTDRVANKCNINQRKVYFNHINYDFI